jgi:putative endonuclease
MKRGYVYIMTNRPDGTLYIGLTDDIKRRTLEHKQFAYDGFTRKYCLNKLVYFEAISDIHVAMKREKQMKKYLRYQKIALIEKYNPEWLDLFETLT